MSDYEPPQNQPPQIFSAPLVTESTSPNPPVANRRKKILVASVAALIVVIGALVASSSSGDKDPLKSKEYKKLLNEKLESDTKLATLNSQVESEKANLEAKKKELEDMQSRVERNQADYDSYIKENE